MRQTGNGQRRKIAKIAKANQKNPKSQKVKMIRKQNSKIKAHIKSEPLRRARTAPHWGTAAQSDQGKVTFSGHKTLLQPHTHTYTHRQRHKRGVKKNNKILFSRLLTLTLTASKSYEPYSLSLPAVPRQKLSLTAWPHKMPSYIQSLPRVPKKNYERETTTI